MVVPAGSSPRVRGIPASRRVDDGNRRFIPAGAGNTLPGSQSVAVNPVHPRGCGEYEGPPQARTLRIRFIPAGAGNTCPDAAKAKAPSVHPRGCGEYGHGRGFHGSAHGSSPRVRGIRSEAPFRLELARFIPAGAGNTPLKSRPR